MVSKYPLPKVHLQTHLASIRPLDAEGVVHNDHISLAWLIAQLFLQYGAEAIHQRGRR